MPMEQTYLPASFQKNENGCKLINGTRLYYEMRGTGQPVVFIHDFSLDHRMWDNQFYYFSKSYKCIRFDLRGYGQSALPGGQYYSFHHDLYSLLVSLNIDEPVVLVGLSMGGLIAVNFALHFPRLAKAIVLANTQVEGYAFRDFRMDTIFNSAERKGIEYAKRKWFAHEIFAHARKNKPVAEALWQMIQFYSGWHLVDDKAALSIEEPPAWENLENIRVPALIIYGDLDLPDFKEIAESAALRIPAAQKIILRDTGHLCNMENPAAFNKELQNFLSDLSEGR